MREFTICEGDGQSSENPWRIAFPRCLIESTGCGAEADKKEAAHLGRFFF
jgi:hypothetical protein